MKIVVFGGSGFLGSHVADALTQAGHQVTIFDMKPSPYLHPKQKMVVGDILDSKAVRAVLRGADMAYHYAGFADLDDARVLPMETVKQNIMGTVNILEAAAEAKIKRFIYASTIYVYSHLGGFYRCSKQAGELYIEEFSRHYNLPYTILRYGSLYGPRANEKNSIWRYLHMALVDKQLVFHGSGDEIREYIHVRDAAKLSVSVLSKDYINEHVLVTGHHAMRARDMIMMIQEILNGKVKIKHAPKKSSIHYNITPYSYIPKVGKKLVSNYYEDMGQGLLECVSDMAKELGS